MTPLWHCLHCDICWRGMVTGSKIFLKALSRVRCWVMWRRLVLSMTCRLSCKAFLRLLQNWSTVVVGASLVHATRHPPGQKPRPCPDNRSGRRLPETRKFFMRNVDKISTYGKRLNLSDCEGHVWLYNNLPCSKESLLKRGKRDSKESLLKRGALIITGFTLR